MWFVPTCTCVCLHVHVCEWSGHCGVLHPSPTPTSSLNKGPTSTPGPPPSPLPKTRAPPPPPGLTPPLAIFLSSLLSRPGQTSIYYIVVVTRRPGLPNYMYYMLSTVDEIATQSYTNLHILHSTYLPNYRCICYKLFTNWHGLHRETQEHVA